MGHGRIGEGVEDYCDRLAEVHGKVPVGRARIHGDGQERVAVTEFVIREARLLGAEEDGDAGVGVAGELGVDVLGGVGEDMQRVFEDSLADGGGSEDEGAVGDGFGDRREFAG